MTKSDSFWQSVRELSAMSARIPEERRRMSGVRHAIRNDVLPESLPLGPRDTQKNDPER
jgi:hypothetical protein